MKNVKLWIIIAAILCALTVAWSWADILSSNAKIKSGEWTEVIDADGEGTFYVRWNEALQDYEYATPTPQ